MDHLESFVAECDKKTELAARRLKETQEELSEEANQKVSFIIINININIIIILYSCFLRMHRFILIENDLFKRDGRKPKWCNDLALQFGQKHNPYILFWTSRNLRAILYIASIIYLSS